jgi:hypothetical protein
MPRPGLCRVEAARGQNVVGSLIRATSVSAYSQTLEEGEQAVGGPEPCWGVARWIGMAGRWRVSGREVARSLATYV